MPVRVSLFRCENCGRTWPANPVEVAHHVRSNWPHCCGIEMTLFIETERPAKDATSVVALPLALPGADPTADTAVIPPPPPRKPAE